ncbi:MAG: hypothetical protein ACJAWV_001672 [Flammeovirgaceae bacterium]|jgi:hypothetical protein
MTDTKKNIVWLASYPKSGNTWMRAFLSALLSNQSDLDINKLELSLSYASRNMFDHVTERNSGEMTVEEIDLLKPKAYEYIAGLHDKELFIKTHERYRTNVEGKPIFPTENTLGVIYIVRNPFDVLDSYAHFRGSTLDNTLSSLLNNSSAKLSPSNEKAIAPNMLQEELGSWSNHVDSWLSVSNMPIHIVRYEDMKNSPLQTFRKAIRFIGLNHDDKAIQKAIDLSAFEKLKSKETEVGFREKSIKAKSFFRKGQINSWRDSLSPEHVSSILMNHSITMKKLGYLDNDNQFTF